MKVIQYLLRHADGTRMAGAVPGREYYIAPGTGLLHRVGPDGKPAKEPGCEPEDAQRFLQFPGFFKEIPAPNKPAPASAPPSVPAGGALPDLPAPPNPRRRKRRANRAGASLE